MAGGRLRVSLGLRLWVRVRPLAIGVHPLSRAVPLQSVPRFTPRCIAPAVRGHDVPRVPHPRSTPADVAASRAAAASAAARAAAAGGRATPNVPGSCRGASGAGVVASGRCRAGVVASGRGPAAGGGEGCGGSQRTGEVTSGRLEGAAERSDVGGAHLG